VAELGKLANARVRATSWASGSRPGRSPVTRRPARPLNPRWSSAPRRGAAAGWPSRWPAALPADMLTALGFTTATADEVAAAGRAWW